MNRTQRCVKCGVQTFKSVSALPTSRANPCISCSTYIVGSESPVAGSITRVLCRCPADSSLVLCNGDSSQGCRPGTQGWCKNCTTYLITSMFNYPGGCPLSSAHIKVGYWRQDHETRLILRCPNYPKCRGGRKSGSCSEGHDGVLCQTCKHDWTLSAGECYPCVSRGTSVALWIGGIILFIMFVALGLCYYESVNLEFAKKTLSLSQSSQVIEIFDEIQMMWQRKSKVVISFYQVVTAIPSSYPVEFEVEFSEIIGFFNFMNMQINDILPVTCLAELDYYTRYLLKAMGPLIITALFYILYTDFLLGQFISSDRKMLLFKVYLFFLFAIYPAMCTSGGESLRCLTTSDTGQPLQRWLKVDYSVNCETPRHRSFLAIDIFFMLLYPIGIPGLFFVLMWEKREELSGRQDRLRLPPELYYLEGLCVAYEAKYWWVEVAECFRKYLLVSICISIFQSYPSSAILLAIVICLVTLLLFQEIAPYEFDMDDVLAYVSHSMLLVIFILAAYTRFSNIMENISSIDVVADKEVYLWNDLVTVASFLVVFVILFAMACSMYEAYEIARNKREATSQAEIVEDADVEVIYRKESFEKLEDVEKQVDRLAQRKAIDTRISQEQTNIVNSQRQIPILEKALSKAERKRAKAIQKLEKIQVHEDSTDSDSSDHHKTLVQMHVSAVTKAREKYDTFQSELSAARSSLKQSKMNIASLHNEQKELQLTLEKELQKTLAKRAWPCQSCKYICKYQYNFCPKCATGRDGTSATSGLTPRLESLEATINLRITARINEQMKTLGLRSDGVARTQEADIPGHAYYKEIEVSRFRNAKPCE